MSSTVNKLLFDLSKKFSVGLVGHESRASSRNRNSLADYVGQQNRPSLNDSTSKMGEGFGPLHDVEVLRNLWHFRIGRILLCDERLPVFGESIDERVPSHVAGAEVTDGSLIVSGLLTQQLSRSKNIHWAIEIRRGRHTVALRRRRSDVGI